MDGYEDLPILLSVIQSNKVNIYCIYIKNYPGIEWRRVAFIGVFPGVRSPRMRARGEQQTEREPESQISLSLSACLGLLRRRRALQPLPPSFGGRVGHHRQSRPPQTWASRAWGAQRLSKQDEPRALTRGLTLGNLGRACD